jgi:hypothetical protein
MSAIEYEPTTIVGLQNFIDISEFLKAAQCCDEYGK